MEPTPPQPAPRARADRPVLTLAQVAERFQLSPTTVAEMAKRGELPFFMLGKRYRFRMADVLAFEDCKIAEARPRYTVVRVMPYARPIRWGASAIRHLYISGEMTKEQALKQCGGGKIGSRLADDISSGRITPGMDVSRLPPLSPASKRHGLPVDHNGQGR